MAEVQNFYGWNYTIDALVSRTQGVNEDMVRCWDLGRFFFRLKFLKDIDEAMEIERTIAEQEAKHGNR